MKNQKNILEIILIFLIILLGYFINNSLSYIPKGSDMQNHIGAVNNIIAGYKTDIGPFPYPMALDLSVAILKLISNIDIPLIFHLFHFILIFLIVLIFYKYGKMHSEFLSYILPLFVILYYSLPDWLGLSYMYPSTFIIFLFPLFLISLKESDNLKTILIIIISLLIYWQLTPFFLLIYFGDYCFKKNKFRYFIYLIIIIFLFLLLINISGIIKNFFFISKINEISVNYLKNIYFENLLKFVSLFFIGFFGLFYIFKKNDYRKVLFLMIISFLLMISLYEYLLIRSTFNFIIFWIILSSFGLIILIKKIISNNFLKIFVMTFIFILLISGIVSNNSQKNFFTDNISKKEIDAFNWLKEYYKQPVVLSDFLTTSLAYSWSLADKSIKELIVKSEERERAYSVLEEKNLSNTSIDYLTTNRVQFIIISNRTSRAIYEHEHNKRLWQPNSPGDPFIEFNGFNKFIIDSCFLKVYDNEEVKIFSFNISKCNFGYS